MDTAALTAKAVAWLGLPATAEGAPAHPDAAACAEVAPSVVHLIDSGQIGRLTQDTPPEWTPDTALGAVMLVARLVRRRNSISGVEQWSGADAAIYTARTDADIARLLRLDRHKAPRIG